MGLVNNHFSEIQCEAAHVEHFTVGGTSPNMRTRGAAQPSADVRKFDFTRQTNTSSYYFCASLTCTNSIRNGVFALTACGSSGPMRMKDPALTWTVSLPIAGKCGPAD